MSSLGSDAEHELPDIDDRLAAPGSRYEVDDGKLVYVPPADEPHGDRHAKLAALLEAHVAPDFNVALDMLTRTSRVDDIAPDASIYPRARDPRTNGRLLDHISFELASTQSLADAGRKAAKLTGRGVRRVFAIDVGRKRVFEWSRDLGTWTLLDRDASIDDPVFAVPLRVDTLLDVARSDDLVARALLAKGNGVIQAAVEAAVEASRAEAIVMVLATRGLSPDADQRTRLLGERSRERLDRWLVAAVTCTSVTALLEL